MQMPEGAQYAKRGNDIEIQTQQQPQSQYDQYSDDGSDGSAEMSIEIGRGAKARAREDARDLSSNIVFSLAGGDDDSQYEVTGTPPIRPKALSRRSTDALRREASVRKATEAVAALKQQQYRSGNGKQSQQSLSETLAKMSAERDAPYMANEVDAPTATFNARNTRFARSRQVSAEQAQAAAPVQSTPLRSTAANNATVQSATYTANSFALPDLPNITELVSGVRRDGTPLISRSSTKRPATTTRSRFTSGSFNPSRQPSGPEYRHVDSIPIPEDEKAIFASLNLLRQRVEELEMEKSEAAKRAEEYENEVIELRSQLLGRGDSALGSSDEEAGETRWKHEKARANAMQKKLERSERKVSVNEISVSRVVRERDELVTQIGLAYFENEELKAQNASAWEMVEKLKERNGELSGAVEGLEKENADLMNELATLQAEKEPKAVKQSEQYGTAWLASTGPSMRRKEEMTGARSSKQQPGGSSIRSKKETKRASERSSVHATRLATNTATKHVLAEPTQDIASRIAQEVQKHRDEAASKQHAPNNRPMAKSVQQRLPRRAVSAPVVESDDSTTHLAIPAISTKHAKAAATYLARSNDKLAQFSRPGEEDTRDITYLSFQDPAEVANLRRRIEEEYRSRHSVAKQNELGHSAAASSGTELDENARPNMPRKSSLKDLTANLNFGNQADNDGTGRFSLGGGENVTTRAGKTVRVLSPHTSDAPTAQPQQDTQQLETEVGDRSTLSNTSRRRRRAASITEGMTSAFILPDITLRMPLLASVDIDIAQVCSIAHDKATCTACPHSASAHANMDIPAPVPVSSRESAQDPDVTSATIRPAQPPSKALATVMKQLNDEITHLKLQKLEQERLYAQHDPALGKKKRELVNNRIAHLHQEVQKRSDWVYALHDVLEGQKDAGQLETQQEVEETLMSIGIDPAELSGRVGRSAPEGVIMEGDESEGSEFGGELPWAGLSDAESGDEL